MNILRVLPFSLALILCSMTLLFANEESNSGTVAETMTSGGYVYVRPEEDDSWLASTPIPVAVGDTVSFSSGIMMKNFSSRTLDRSFEDIRFVQTLKVISVFDNNAHSTAAARNSLNFEKSQVVETPELGEIEPLEGGETISGIVTQAVSMESQQVSLRAKVTKVNKNILGKNWITLQDGTGTAPDNKLIATSQELAEVGTVVLVKGTVMTNVDLGMGYKYKVMLDGATFTK